MKHIVFDIETGPAPNAREFCKEPKDKRNKSIEDQLSDAALSALTGRVLLVGCMNQDGSDVRWFEGPEDYLLRNFWDFYNSMKSIKGDVRWIGFNCASFDWPFLVQRSYINGVKPAKVFNERGYLVDSLIDLRHIWGCGDKKAAGTLDLIGRAMGFAGKTGDGAQFAALYNATATRQQAIDYCHADLILTASIATRML
jgi:uncharacterized protein YprB with RNaseH-like and TPR domain